MLVNQAFILAAWYWTRLRPLTLEKPKPLLPIYNKPLLAYHFDNLQKYWVSDFFVNTFYLSDQIDIFVQKYVENKNIKIHVSHEEWEILWTAWGIMKQFDNLDDYFFVVYWDNLTNFDYSKYLQFLEWKEFDVSIVLYREEHIEEKWMAVVDQNWYIQSFIEKPKKEQIVSNLANAGIYLIKKNIFKEFCPKNWFFDFSHDFFPLLLKNNKKILSYLGDYYLLDIGNIEKYTEANAYVERFPVLFDFSV